MTMPLIVEKIESGSVIDHIEAGRGLRVLNILGIDEGYKGRVALVMNAPSKKMGRKDIVKIEGRHVDEKTANKIALIAPKASLNLIEHSDVVEKHRIMLQKVLVGIFKCPNPRCITNFEAVDSEFRVEKEGLRCKYCERVFKAEELI
jgi:aspartate carbamoyltransferase regulatory subunit